MVEGTLTICVYDHDDYKEGVFSLAEFSLVYFSLFTLTICVYDHDHHGAGVFSQLFSQLFS